MICENKGGLVYNRSPLIAAPHLFTTRFGGVSSGVYATLNTSFTVGDAAENVHENINRAAAALGFTEADVVCSNQVHSDCCVKVGVRDKGVGTRKPVFPFPADAMMTDEKGVLLLVRIADCTPVLLYDKTHGAVAAIHSGWRGTLADICKNTVSAMQREYGTKPEELAAAIGPCISAESFEVGDEVAELFAENGYSDFISHSYDKPHIDVAGICEYQLKRLGVNAVDVSGECTKINNNKYFSHRAQGAKRGLLAALIGIK